MIDVDSVSGTQAAANTVLSTVTVHERLTSRGADCSEVDSVNGWRDTVSRPSRLVGSSVWTAEMLVASSLAIMENGRLHFDERL